MRLRDGVHPVTAEERTHLVDVWEAAVRATHHFLSESDIQFFKPRVARLLIGLEPLLCVRDTDGAMVGFVGVADQKMEALFVHPAWHRAGIGRRLATHVIDMLGVNAVDVLEQNVPAVAFYRRLGFVLVGRSSVEGRGLPLPLLHLRLPSASES
jgi:putative acetyltransferase